MSIHYLMEIAFTEDAQRKPSINEFENISLLHFQQAPCRIYHFSYINENCLKAPLTRGSFSDSSKSDEVDLSS